MAGPVNHKPAISQSALDSIMMYVFLVTSTLAGFLTAKEIANVQGEKELSFTTGLLLSFCVYWPLKVLAYLGIGNMVDKYKHKEKTAVLPESPVIDSNPMLQDAGNALLMSYDGDRTVNLDPRSTPQATSRLRYGRTY
jgi:hypothetical protein